MDEQRPPGLYLKPPHGELSFTGAKRALAKARDFGFEDQRYTLCSGPVAWGELVLSEPEVVTVGEFDARFGEHRVSVKERTKWWPDEDELYIYAYKEWRPFGKPRRVAVPATVQTLMGPVEFLGEEVDMGQGTVININTGTEPPTTMPEDVTLLKRAMAGDGEAAVELEGGEEEPCSDCPEEDGGKAVKVWTAADAEEHTSKADTPAKRQQWASAANSSLKDCLAEVEGTPTKEQRSSCEGRAVRIANAAVKKNPAKEKEAEVTDRRDKQSIEGLSLSDITSMMWDALAPPSTTQAVVEDRKYPRNVEVYNDYVTYELDGKHYKRNYTIVDNKIQLGEPVEIEWIMRPKGLEDLSEGYKAELVQEFDALELGDKSLGDDEKAALTSAQRRALPEKSFAWVETGEGCEKGEDGKRPMKCLHLPYKKADGTTLDCARVRNARGRIPQMSGVPQAAKDKIAAAQKKCTAQTATARGKGLREQADKVLEAAAALWKSVTGPGEETAVPDLALDLEGETGFKVLKGADGKARIVTWTMNAFIDRDEEIFSTKSIEEYAERAWKEIVETGRKGQYDFWHAPGSEFADITFAGVIGRFLLEMGEFHDDEVGRAFEKFFTECPEAVKDMAPDGWGTSHRFKFRPEDKVDGVFNWFDKDRTSVLAVGRAANPYTAMEVLSMKGLNDEQREMLTKAGEALGIEDFPGKVEKLGKDATKDLEDANVAHKDADPEPDAEEDEGKKPAPEPAGQPATEEVEAVAQRVAELMGTKELSKWLQTLKEGDEAVKDELAKLAGRLDDVEKGDLERLEEKQAWRPDVVWLQPTKADSTLLDEEKDKGLKDKKPEIPQAIKAVTEGLLGGRASAGGGEAS